jgi:hypothetical protein
MQRSLVPKQGVHVSAVVTVLRGAELFPTASEAAKCLNKGIRPGSGCEFMLHVTELCADEEEPGQVCPLAEVEAGNRVTGDAEMGFPLPGDAGRHDVQSSRVLLPIWRKMARTVRAEGRRCCKCAVLSSPPPQK